MPPSSRRTIIHPPMMSPVRRKPIAVLRNLLTSVCISSAARDRKSTRLNSSHSQISYAVFCLKKKNPVHGAVHQDREVIPVLLEQLELERVGQRVGRDPRLGVRLESADHQPADLLLDVGVAVRVAQDREVPVDSVDLLGDHVDVFFNEPATTEIYTLSLHDALPI